MENLDKIAVPVISLAAFIIASYLLKVSMHLTVPVAIVGTAAVYEAYKDFKLFMTRRRIRLRYGAPSFVISLLGLFTVLNWISIHKNIEPFPGYLLSLVVSVAVIAMISSFLLSRTVRKRVKG
ncbi:hypothetical protein DRO02_02235 [archaeon]|nr:MAG: hypothetical protein DRO21_02765 [archaeon]RLG65374.1 MAG: hypothetical protein DRO02_02235 [archaeon]RLG66550.1 MAG: hypothetical protein DRN89_00660 [archaeon]